MIDYTAQDFASGEQTYDLILDNVGNRTLSELRRALAPKGTLIPNSNKGSGRWLGGYLRQFQVQLDPERMSARKISLDEVRHAVDESNVNASGGIVAQGAIEWTVRAVGRATSVDDVRRTVVTVRGKLGLDRDFTAGYAYPVIIEEATFSK